jgi:hypothetical protein
VSESQEEISEILPKYDKEDADAVKDLVTDIAGIASDACKEHFGEMDIGKMAENVDRNKVAEFMDESFGLLKNGIELLKDVFGELN